MKQPFILQVLEDVVGVQELDMFELHVLRNAQSNLKRDGVYDTGTDYEKDFPISFLDANANFGTVREALLKSVTSDFDWCKYIAGIDSTNHFYDDRDALFHLRYRYTLAAVASWMKLSRRVFQLTDELQTLLSLTSLKNTDWSMLEWPFDSFIINLHTPMFYGEGEHRLQCDAILIGRETMLPGNAIVFNGEGEYGEDNGEGNKFPFSIHLLRRGLNSLNKQYPILERSKLLRQIENNPSVAWNKVLGIRRKQIYQRPWFSIYMPSSVLEVNGVSDYLYGETSEALDAGSTSTGVRDILEVMFGTLLYIASLQKSKRAIAENSEFWTKSKTLPSSSFGRQITESSLIALIGSEIKMSPEELLRFREHIKLSKSDREVSAHFRIGYFRRIRGQGQNPEAPKSEWVRPCIVRRDRLEEGTLPVGAVSILK